MASDKEILQALETGIVLQSTTSIEQNITGIEMAVTEENSEATLKNMVFNQGNNVDQHIENIPEVSVGKLKKLEVLIDEPEKNEEEIRDIYNWFKEHVPLVASVISICNFAITLGLG